LEIPQADLRDPLAFQVSRPIILIAPYDETRAAWIPPRSLANRTVTVELPAIAAPRAEFAIWRDFDALRPGMTATLCDALSQAMRGVRDVDLAEVSRFPDSVVWAAAAAPALGLDQSEIAGAFGDRSATWSGSDPLRDGVHALLDQTGGEWAGNATALLEDLRAMSPEASFPATPKGLTQALPRIPGIKMISRRIGKGVRTLSIVRLGDASQLSITKKSWDE